jgi:hypothetical protein
MLRKLIIRTVFLVLTLMVVSLVAAANQGAVTDERTPVTTGSSDVGKDGSKQTLEVPALLRPIPGETEADKLERMAQFIKENRPQHLIPKREIPEGGTAPKSQLPFCVQFMEDLIQMRSIEAIEPDFVTGSHKEVEDKLKLKHCEDIKHHSVLPPGENPQSWARGIIGFKLISDIGGPPYRFYNIQLDPG